ncbi:hypothetical protein ACJMK2_002757 [Sinanodonta woodiana]|uniref:Claudin n=1 Tax=Sinanodonta woodiana TaxID=1069815 RepID=A0ABD3XY03_SINWO
MPGNIAVGIACTSVVIGIISIALPYWCYLEKSDGPVTVKKHYGLWIYCEESTIYVKTKSTCDSFALIPEFFEAVRMLEVIGLLFVLGAVVLGAIKSAKENGTIQHLAGGLAALGGVLMISGTVVFALNIVGLVGPIETLRATYGTDILPSNILHAGFALAIVSGVIALISGCVFFCSKSVKVTQVRPHPATLNF